MSTPIPIVASHPVGWALLGVAGFLTYKAGKKSGSREVNELEKPGLGDRAVKGAMKAVYKAKKNVESTFSKAGEKYGAMWAEARDEAQVEE